MPFSAVQNCEHDQIVERRRILGVAVSDPPYRDEHSYLGLSISGGGIRSATFSLGIIQKLAECRILKHIDYLSTVSGGGYIGAWLCSWIRREQTNELYRGKAVEPAVPAEAYPEPKLVFEDICKALSPSTPPGPMQPEAREVAFLRQYSNYLTPRVSVFSADTWLVAAVWSRNTLLNLAILVAAFGSVVLLARLLGMGASHLFSCANDESIRAVAICAGLLVPMVGLIGWNLWWNSTIALQNGPPKRERSKEQSDTWVIVACFSPLFSAIGYSFWLTHARGVFVLGSLWDGVWLNFLVLSVAFLFLQTCARVYRCHIEKKKETLDEKTVPWYSHAFSLLLYVIGPAGAGFVTAALLRALALLFDSGYNNPDQPWFVLTFGPPLVLVAFAVGVVVHVGLMGRDLPEASREWLSRLRAWLMVFSFFWLIVFGVAIYGPWLVAVIGVKSSTAVAGLGSGWILSTAGGLFAGKSAKTSGKSEDDAKRGGFSWTEALAWIGPYLFMAGFATSVALGAHFILVHALEPTGQQAARSGDEVEKYNLQVRDNKIQVSREVPKVEDKGFQWLLNRYWLHLSQTELCVQDSKLRWYLSGLIPLFIVLVVAGGLLAWRVDVNHFSMHNFYKSRLVRCYLGASRQGRRRPNPFTGFDDYDDAPLDQFINKEHYIGPYPILNAALNVTSGGKLQYQERQAQSYIFTPFYTGYSAETVSDEMRLGDDTRERSLSAYQSNTGAATSAYRPTRLTGARVGVGMAMAISGAAVNPNMGYHSSTAVSFLLTVFNVRLGWWLGNTLKSSFRRQGPSFGLLYSFRELFGLANANSSYVNLSDGGHFENMGIYELVRRKCRYIICCDGEQDSGPTFGGIGNAIRKCRTDFGVEIDLPLERLRKVDGFSRVHCAVGHIQYPNCNYEGYIVYLKSSLTGDEPTDILSYGSDHCDFPQQTTGDQWFDESQFESYRRLGYHVAEKAFASVDVRDPKNPDKPDCKDLLDGRRQDFFDALYQVWYPPSREVDKTSPAHSDMYTRVLEAVRKETALKDLDSALFAGYDATKWDHNSGHICNSLIQLMERVFYDLGLEDVDARKHPFVKGWLDIFDHWINDPEFQKAWTVVASSYPERFRTFYESRIKQPPSPSGTGGSSKKTA